MCTPQREGHCLGRRKPVGGLEREPSKNDGVQRGVDAAPVLRRLQHWGFDGVTKGRLTRILLQKWPIRQRLPKHYRARVDIALPRDGSGEKLLRGHVPLLPFHRSEERR